MKKFLVILLIAIVAIGLWKVYSMKSEMASRYSIDDLQKIAMEANKNLPTMIDQYTRLDEVAASDHLLEKRYTLVTLTESDALHDQLKNQLFPSLITESCKNKQSINLYNNGVAEAFTYSDMNKKHLATFRIDKDSCK